MIDSNQRLHINGAITQRQEMILEKLQKTGWVRITDLAAMLSVSSHTVRRDLLSLEKQRLVKRIRGGAVLHETAVSAGPAKSAIGKAAASLVSVGETVCIDAGTTTLEVARNLPAGIDVLTNSIDIAHELAKRSSDIGVNLCGGSLEPGGNLRTGLSGPFAIEFIRRSGPISKTIISASGVSYESGVTDRYHYIAEVKREMVQVAQTAILVCHAEKLGTRFLEPVCALSEIDILVTDQGADKEQIKAFERAGVEVVVAR